MNRQMQATVREVLDKARDPATVVRARLPGGRIIQVTGHARLEAWRENPAARPKTFNLVEIEVSTENEAAQLYEAFEHLLAPEMM